MTEKQSPWATILAKSEIDAYHALTASIDPVFAEKDRAFYQRRDADQLRVLSAQAWDCNDSTGYQMARSYAALLQVAA